MGGEKRETGDRIGNEAHEAEEEEMVARVRNESAVDEGKVSQTGLFPPFRASSRRCVDDQEDECSWWCSCCQRVSNET